jgi:PAS domain S-box-containing protein
VSKFEEEQATADDTICGLAVPCGEDERSRLIALEASLRQRERELAEAYRIARMGTFRWLKKEGKVLWSEAVYRMFGVDPGRPVPRGAETAALMTPESWERISKATYEALETGMPYSMDLELVDRDGSGRRWVTVRGEGLKDADGEVVELAGTVQDVTERRRVEEALRESQTRFQKLYDSDLIGIGFPDADGSILDGNDALLRMIGYTREDMEAGLVRWDTMTPPEYRELDRMHLAEAAERGSCTPYEKEYIRKDGSRVPILCGFARLESEGPGAIGFVMDLSAQKLAEEAVRRTEKLAAAGRLAATIAHEINNPLAAVTNALYLALMDEGLSETTRSYLHMAEQELARAAHVTTQTLQFHRQISVPAEASVAEVMDSALALFATRFKSSSVAVELEYSVGRKLLCCADELRQVFANLLSNALDAMRHGGRMRIRIRAAQAWDGQGRAGVRVTLGDTGSGIPAEVRARIFEPFLSTKEATGTGLGLWVSEGIVHKHKGRIQVKSRTGQASGTVFSLFLPWDGMGPAA